MPLLKLKVRKGIGNADVDVDIGIQTDILDLQQVLRVHVKSNILVAVGELNEEKKGQGRGPRE